MKYFKLATNNMGSSSSKSFEEMFENPPPTPPVGKRFVTQEIDPRSPSCQINRTPIQVSKSPEPVADPRSPTNGIDRTPIVGKTQNASGGCSPMACSALPEDEKEVSQESTGESTARYNSTEDLLPGQVNLTPDGSKGALKKKKKPKTLFKIHTTPTPKNVSPYKVKNGEMTPSKDGTTSPLGSRNVDYNSPRAILQKKQTDKLAFMKSGIPRRCAPKYQVMEDDKENVKY